MRRSEMRLLVVAAALVAFESVAAVDRPLTPVLPMPAVPVALRDFQPLGSGRGRFVRLQPLIVCPVVFLKSRLAYCGASKPQRSVMR